MNYMPKVLEMLNLEVGEKFNVKGWYNNPYHFRKEDYALSNNSGYHASDTTLLELLTGKNDIKIEKLPWKPKEGCEYYTILSTGIINRVEFEGYKKDYYNYNAGNCFRTAEEITDEIKQRILQEMKGKYEND